MLYNLRNSCCLLFVVCCCGMGSIKIYQDTKPSIMPYYKQHCCGIKQIIDFVLLIWNGI